MIDFLSLVKFPVLIAAKGTHACYHHVVVIWKQMVIEFESKYTYPLTNDSLTQICGINTAFRGISCGYGIFPSVHIRQSFGNFDWGYFEYTMKKSLIRKYFKS